MFDGKVRVLQNVRCIANLSRNLLFGSVFDKLGCSINIFNGVREVSRDGTFTIKSINKNGLYHAMTLPDTDVANFDMSLLVDKSKFCHFRPRLIGNLDSLI